MSRAFKDSKEEVDYRKGTSRRHCSLCTMYREPASCTAVAGVIRRDGLCDEYETRK